MLKIWISHRIWHGSIRNLVGGLMSPPYDMVPPLNDNLSHHSAKEKRPGGYLRGKIL